MSSASPLDRPLRVLAGVLGVALLTLWHRLVRAVAGPPPAAPETASDADVVEYEPPWPRYLRGFAAHHGPDGDPDRSPGEGSLLVGLVTWADTRFLRGYTLGDRVYVCPGCPTVVRVHQTGHAPSFGAAFEPLARPRRADGGLPDEPLHTLDVMLPGRFPHTLLRWRDPRGLTDAYRRWLRDGRLARRG